MQVQSERTHAHTQWPLQGQAPFSIADISKRLSLLHHHIHSYIPKERALASNALAAALGSASGLHTPNGKSVGQMAERSQSLFKYGLPFN